MVGTEAQEGRVWGEGEPWEEGVFISDLIPIIKFFKIIFLCQGSNQGLPHCKQILYHLSHQGST